MNRQRSQWIIGAALAAFILAFTLIRGVDAGETPYDLNSTGPAGLHALRLWLVGMGYQVAETGAQQFAIPTKANLLFVYPNRLPYREGDAVIARRWVEDGGTMVLIGPAARDAALVAAFHVSTALYGSFSDHSRQVQPLLPDANGEWIHFNAGDSLDLTQAPQAVAALATSNGRVTVAVEQLGSGTVWYFSPDHDFTNESLRDEDQAKLLPAVLRTVPKGGMAVFDTYHMFGQIPGTAQITSLQDWLYKTPLGWASVFAVGSLLLYLFLQGWRLGPPLIENTMERGREAAEYVAAMASLQRRARLGNAVAQHHKNRLKTGLGRRLHIPADLPDDEFMRRLSQTDYAIPSVDLQTIDRLLHQYATDSTDTRLVSLVVTTDELLNRYGKQPIR